MIYLEGLESIVECIYLNDELDNKISSCDVFVNPESIKYLTGKTIIINIENYPREKIESLLKNECRVVSRIYTDQEGVEVRPYILRLNSSIKWNGRVIKDFDNFTDLLSETNDCEFSIDDYILYFPKIESVKSGDKRAMDSYGNLTVLGWALQQVGINLVSGAFTDLDIVKTEKIMY